MTKQLSIVSIAGARPNFMKIGPLAKALAHYPSVEHRLVHTGQHYDQNMSDLFFRDLGLPKPWRNLEVGSGNHATQTAEIMTRFDRVMEEAPADLVVVVGDVNSTIACALVAAKRGIPVAHVEAGLRSYDRSMPEEINRLLTDAISDVLLVSEPSGVDNLRREGVPDDRVHLVGNVMIDTLLSSREKARTSMIHATLGIAHGAYGVVTLHRPSNVDDPAVMRELVGVLGEIARSLPLVFPVHPRTSARLKSQGVELRREAGFLVTDPLGYLDFLALMEGARIILTDSGGIQEEACILEVPCLTLRENTERPVTVSSGWNDLVGRDPEKIRGAAKRALSGQTSAKSRPALWDGRAGERIAEILVRRYGS